MHCKHFETQVKLDQTKSSIAINFKKLHIILSHSYLILAILFMIKELYASISRIAILSI